MLRMVTVILAILVLLTLAATCSKAGGPAIQYNYARVRLVPVPVQPRLLYAPVELIPAPTFYLVPQLQVPVTYAVPLAPARTITEIRGPLGRLRRTIIREGY